MSERIEATERLIATLIAGQARVRHIAHSRLSFSAALAIEMRAQTGLAQRWSVSSAVADRHDPEPRPPQKHPRIAPSVQSWTEDLGQDDLVVRARPHGRGSGARRGRRRRSAFRRRRGDVRGRDGAGEGPGHHVQRRRLGRRARAARRGSPRRGRVGAERRGVGRPRHGRGRRGRGTRRRIDGRRRGPHVRPAHARHGRALVLGAVEPR